MKIHYPQPCIVCGSGIIHTNRRGRPSVKCERCVVQRTRIIEHDFGGTYYDRVCRRCESPIEKTGNRGRPPAFCYSCDEVLANHVPF